MAGFRDVTQPILGGMMMYFLKAVGLAVVNGISRWATGESLNQQLGKITGTIGDGEGWL